MKSFDKWETEMREIQPQITHSIKNKYSNSRKKESYVSFKSKLMKGSLTERQKNQ